MDERRKQVFLAYTSQPQALPLSRLRGKCTVRTVREIAEDVSVYCEEDAAFFYEHFYDHENKCAGSNGQL